MGSDPHQTPPHKVEDVDLTEGLTEILRKDTPAPPYGLIIGIGPITLRATTRMVAVVMVTGGPILLGLFKLLIDLMT